MSKRMDSSLWVGTFRPDIHVFGNPHLSHRNWRHQGRRRADFTLSIGCIFGMALKSNIFLCMELWQHETLHEKQKDKKAGQGFCTILLMIEFFLRGRAGTGTGSDYILYKGWPSSEAQINAATLSDGEAGALLCSHQ